MRCRWPLLGALVAIVAAPCSLRAEPSLETEPLVRALRDELARTRTMQLPGVPPPYYVAYTVHDVRALQVAGEFGGLVRQAQERSRGLVVSLRVGSPQLDNARRAGSASEVSGQTPLPLDDDYQALRRRIWLATDAAYKQAVEAFEIQRAAAAQAPRDADHPADFVLPTGQRLATASDEPTTPAAGRAEALVRRLSALCWDFPAVDEAAIALRVGTTTRTLVSSTGALIRDVQSLVEVAARASTRPSDGEALEARWQVAAPTLDALPPAAAMAAAWRDTLHALVLRRTAPRGEDYSGPVLFEGRAAAQLVRVLLAAHLSGTTPLQGLPDPLRADTAFEGKLGRQVVANNLDLVDDPTLTRYADQPLVGSYAADDEGTPPRRVQLVRRGQLAGLLMALTPRRGLVGSTGHGRYAIFGPAAARPGNLLLSAGGGLSRAQLVRRLLQEAKRAGEDYGLIVRALALPGKLATLGELVRSAATPRLRPLVVLKVTADGQEIPLRGLELAAIPLGAFKRVLAAGREAYVDNAAGPALLADQPDPRWVASSVAAPALLIADLDLKRQPPRPQPPPLLPRPER
ncbi:MAG: hypothetical protein IPG96_15320 [Proteobacteria bacterium]|nr:hypothetical protein [Pseudomonadota bacterium]